jgi:hypothetical protein
MEAALEMQALPMMQSAAHVVYVIPYLRFNSILTTLFQYYTFIVIKKL